ncbi:hypothetical protein LCGC14_1008530 [marine sediment metagenome]|uniref:Uncharacterized protein n=1 Tax=marine sediment metagenome TaxID=412755 RepID=A0A0F9R727_9ZZZZ
MSIVSHRVITDIFNLENVVSDIGMVAGKNILIDSLRNIFAQDREYKYVSDIFGFPKTPTHLNLDPVAGLDDDETTRIFIGSTYRYDIKFNPSIIVKHTGSRYVPISFNQNLLGIINRKEIITDGYGNSSTIYTPAYHTLMGAWDQTFEVKIVAENEIDREEIADIVQVSLMGTRRMDLQQAGLFIKTMSTSGETEEKYSNDYLYMVSISLDTRSEWKVHIPISDIIERIGVCLTFNTIGGAVADGLTINEQITLADTI